MFFFVSWCPCKCSAISALLNLEYTLDPQRLKSQAPNKTDDKSYTKNRWPNCGLRNTNL